jgi:hypothetical protein
MFVCFFRLFYFLPTDVSNCIELKIASCICAGYVNFSYRVLCFVFHAVSIIYEYSFSCFMRVCGEIFCACCLRVIFSFKSFKCIMHVLKVRGSKALELEDDKIRQTNVSKTERGNIQNTAKSVTGTLVIWNTTKLQYGLYWVRLG